MAIKPRYYLLPASLLMSLGLLLWLALMNCNMLRKAGDPVSTPMLAAYYKSEEDYFSSKLWSLIPVSDSLLNLSYLHFTPSYDAWVLPRYRMRDNTFFDIAQINLRRFNQVFLPLRANRRGQVLLDSLMLSGSGFGYDFPPVSVVSEQGEAFLVFVGRGTSDFLKITYAKGMPRVSEAEQEVPWLSMCKNGKNLVCTLSYSSNKTKITAYEPPELSLNGKLHILNGTAEPKILLEVMGMPLSDDICLFDTAGRQIATLPIKSEMGVQMAIFDLDERQLIDLLPPTVPNAEWCALKAGPERLFLASSEPSSDVSAVYNYEVSTSRLSQITKFKGKILDAAETGENGLILLSSKGLRVVDSSFEPRFKASLKEGERLFGVRFKDRQLWVVHQPQKQQLRIYDAELAYLGSLKISIEHGDIYALALGFSDSAGSPQLQLAILANSRQSDFQKLIANYLEVLPENRWANLLFRGREQTLKVSGFIRVYLAQHPLAVFGYLVLLTLAIVLSLKFSRQLVNNKINDLGSLLPIPKHDKKYLSLVLELLKKPNLATAAILNIDIVDFSSLVRQYHEEPELLRQTLMDFYDMFIEEVAKNGGTIGKIMGDGIIAVFGWPNLGKLYLNDARKNLEAALETAQNVQQKPLLVRGIRLEYRQGITLGDVFIGYYGNSFRKDYIAMGSPIMLSELIQKAAPTNAICSDAQVAAAIIEHKLPYSAIPFGEQLYGDEAHQSFLLRKIQDK